MVDFLIEYIANNFLLLFFLLERSYAIEILSIRHLHIFSIIYIFIVNIIIY